MQTYTRLGGDVIDLSRLTDDERTYLERVIGEWRAGADYNRLRYELVAGPSNPLVGPSRVVRREVMDHPLWLALRDIEDRQGIAEHCVGPAPGDRPDLDPLDDELVAISEAARRKGVTRASVYNAIARGDVVAVRGSGQPRVSVRSLDGWQVNPERQQTGRRGRLARAG